MQCAKTAGSLRPRGRHPEFGFSNLSEIAHKLTGAFRWCLSPPPGGGGAHHAPPIDDGFGTTQQDTSSASSSKYPRRSSAVGRPRGDGPDRPGSRVGRRARGVCSRRAHARGRGRRFRLPAGRTGDADAVRRGRRRRRAVPEAALRRPAGLARDHRPSRDRSRRAHHPAHPVGVDAGGAVR